MSWCWKVARWDKGCRRMPEQSLYHPTRQLRVPRSRCQEAPASFATKMVLLTTVTSQCQIELACFAWGCQFTRAWQFAWEAVSGGFVPGVFFQVRSRKGGTIAWSLCSLPAPANRKKAFRDSMDLCHCTKPLASPLCAQFWLGAEGRAFCSKPSSIAFPRLVSKYISFIWAGI